MIWSDAKLCVMLGRTDLFTRGTSVLEKYDEYKDALVRNGIHIEDVIRKKMNGADVKWMRNAFPYDVVGTRHYLIWSTSPLEDEKIREIALMRTGTLEFITFVNPEEQKSVTGLWHAHCLIKMND